MAAEAIGTAFLLAIVIGSGIMGERLSDEQAAVTLLVNSLATGAGLAVFILVLEPISGAHFNPAVTFVEAVQDRLAWRDLPFYILAQLAGAFIGVAAAHAMFGEPLFSSATHIRSGWAQWWSEYIATFGLLFTIASCARHRPACVPFAVGAYIAAAYWFTASTSFANPAVTLARAMSDTFAGIRPVDVPPFIFAQLLGAFSAAIVFRWLSPVTSPAPARKRGDADFSRCSK